MSPLQTRKSPELLTCHFYNMKLAGNFCNFKAASETQMLVRALEEMFTLFLSLISSDLVIPLISFVIRSPGWCRQYDILSSEEENKKRPPHFKLQQH